MGKELTAFWTAAQEFRAAQDVEAKHNARVALLGIALGNNKVGQRAADLLRTEGLVVIRESYTLENRA